MDLKRDVEFESGIIVHGIVVAKAGRVHNSRDLCCSESRVMSLREPSPSNGTGGSGGHVDPRIPVPGAVTCPTPFRYETTGFISPSRDKYKKSDCPLT